MRDIRSLAALPKDRRLAVTIGTFDGLHRGHQAVLETLCRKARASTPRLLTVLISIKNRTFKSPDAGALLDAAHRRRLLSELGVDLLVELDFERVRHLGHEDFLRLLARGRRLAFFCASDKLRFGENRLGTPKRVRSALARLCPEAEVRYLPSVTDGSGGPPLSASRIRGLIEKGEVGKAHALLTRPYRLEGVVRHGRKLGRTLGFPTLNQLVPPGRVIPREGVYFTRVTVSGLARAALTFIGRPWIQQAPGAPPPPFRMESFLFNFSKSVYNRHAQVEFLRFIRGNRRFSGVDALRKRMEADAAIARGYFHEAALPADPSPDVRIHQRGKRKRKAP